MKLGDKLLYIIDNQYSGNRKKFADVVDIPYTTITDYVKFNRHPTVLDHLEKISITCNVPLEWLVSDKDERNINILSFNSNSNLNTGKKQKVLNEEQTGYGKDAEIETLKKQIGDLERMLQAKDQTIAVQEKLIKALEK